MPQKTVYSSREAVKRLEALIGRDLFGVEALKARYENGEEKRDETVFVSVSRKDYQDLVGKAFPTIKSKAIRFFSTYPLTRLVFGDCFDLEGTNICVVDKESGGLVNKSIPKPDDIRYWASYEKFRK